MILQTVEISGDAVKYNVMREMPDDLGNGEQPDKIRFVSPTFSNSAPFFSNIDDALNSFTGTLVVYEGTYKPTANFACNVVAIGKVKIDTISAGNINVFGANLTISNLNISSGTTANIEAFEVSSINLTNSSAHIKVDDANYITLLGTSNLNFEGTINNRIQAVTGEGTIHLKSPSIASIEAGDYFTLFVQADTCNALQANSSCICHLEIKKILAESSIIFKGFAKVAFYHSNIRLTTGAYLFLQGEVTIKLKNSFLTGSVAARGIVHIETYDQLVVSNSTIVNNDMSGFSISSVSPNTDVYVYGESCGNQPNDKINELVSGFIVDTNLINEKYF